MSEHPVFSVVIPTYNRRERLVACLDSLARQSLGVEKFEVIVVDDGSTDGTPEAVAEFRLKRHFRVSCHCRSSGGPGAARNYGASMAAGRILAFTEDDIEVDAQWLEFAEKYFVDMKNPGIEGLTRLKNISGSLRAFESPSALGFLPCNLFVRKEVFEDVGGYDLRYFDLERFLYFREDADFGFRLLERGHTIARADDVKVVHPSQFSTPEEIYRHAQRYYFDPLLHRQHPALFRRMIEAKKIGGVTFHRPMHYLCLTGVVSAILALGIEALGGSEASSVFLVTFLLSVAGIGIKYWRSGSFRMGPVIPMLAFIPLPFYYFYWFLRGCFRFRSFGALI